MLDLFRSSSCYSYLLRFAVVAVAASSAARDAAVVAGDAAEGDDVVAVYEAACLDDADPDDPGDAAEVRGPCPDAAACAGDVDHRTSCPIPCS